MADNLSISMPCNALFNCFRDCIAGEASYIHNLEENFDALRTEADKLRALRNDVRRRVGIEEGHHLQRLDQVECWLSRVEVELTEVEELIGDGPREVEKLCLGGFCSKNCRSSYKFGKKLVKKIKIINDLRSEGNFDRVTERLLSGLGDERPSEPTVGLDSVLDKVWNRLLDEEIGIIGLYGMGGVGKTTLLTQINNRLIDDNPSCFNHVIWIVVSRDASLEKVQDEIRKKLKISDEMWKNKSQDKKTVDVFKVLSKKKFVLFLDDIWNRIDLVKVGVPLPNRQNGSKVIFTTRSEEVCCQMEANAPIKVECLAWDEAWDLFQQKVGNETLHSNSEILELAGAIVEKCNGLPLALITIGRAMACKKTPQEWHHAVEVLRRWTPQFSGMRNDVLPLLKLSYDYLASDTHRSCLLYCALFPEDFVIPKTELIDYWIAEGFFSEECVGLRNKGYDMIGNLVHSCLLEEADDCVQMHDVIRDMALWIGSEGGEARDKYLVQTDVELADAPELERWEGVRRMSLIGNSIECLREAPTCPNLSTLFLEENDLLDINDDFFRFMPALRVLNLSCNQALTELPKSVSSLASLQCLNLSETNIWELPMEITTLVNLKCLNLEHTNSLYPIPPKVISSFTRLQVLRIFCCGRSYGLVEDDILSSKSGSLVEELQHLKHLNLLTVNIKSNSALTNILKLDKFEIFTEALSLSILEHSNSLDISFLKQMNRLETICIRSCQSLESLRVDWPSETTSVIQISNLFHNLGHVQIEDCTHLVDITWLMIAPNLKCLQISNCKKLEEIVCSRKLDSAIDMSRDLNPFAKLESLELEYLAQLKSIYGGILPLPCLQEICVKYCPMLKKLPLDSKSGKEFMDIYGDQHWWDDLEWVDEEAKDTFILCFTPL